MSAKTGRAPARTNAFAVETNVKDGRMTSSPGPTAQRSAAISSAAAQDVVSSAFATPHRSSIIRQHAAEKRPSPAVFPRATASAM